MKNLRVPEPVGGSGKSNTTRADREREDLANDDPGGGTPGRGEEEDVDADEGDEAVSSYLRVGKDRADDGDCELADCHCDGAVDQERATTEALDGEDCDPGGHEVFCAVESGEEAGEEGREAD